MKKLRLLLVPIALLVLAGRPDKANADSLATLYNFSGGGDGNNPLGTLVLGTNGNLYGTTYKGGGNGDGTVFTITPQGTLTTLYTFGGEPGGSQPRGALVQGFDGNFYGTTYSGGSVSNMGTIFSISSTGMLTSIYQFSGSGDGGQPFGGLVQGGNSNFYGTTSSGGKNGFGTVFTINSQGTLTTLYSFANNGDGANPEAGLIAGPSGHFYGTTYSGGTYGLGTVFKISTQGTLTTLYSFAGNPDGANPEAGLVMGVSSNLYGTTVNGGSSSNGTVFEIGPEGTELMVYNFTGGEDGAFPQAELIRGTDGNFYGTASAGGSSGFGTIFKFSANGSFTPLHSFTGSDGANPGTGLLQGSVTNFYGTTTTGGIDADTGGTVFSFVQPCSYALPINHVTFPAIADSGTFSITTGLTNCPWATSNTVDWITITSGDSGIGDGTISYSVTVNTSTNQRVGYITVGGKAFTVTQQAQVFGQFLAGTYNGLIVAGTPAQASSGFLSLVLGKTGGFQADLTIGGVKSAFKGQFDTAGDATNTIVRKNLPALQVVLQLLSVTNGTDEITGTVSNGVFTADVVADLAIFSHVNPCPFAGRYTFVLEPADNSDPTVPQGFGYGTLTVTTLGNGQMQGVLGDGTKIPPITYPVSGLGTWPLYAPLYSNQGSCIGLVNFAASNTLTATVNWFKPAELKQHDYPAGFTTAVTLTGEIYAPTKTITAENAQLTLGGGDLESNLVKTLAIDTHGNVAVSPTGEDKLTLKITPGTGQFSGSFINPADGKAPAKLGGQILQSDDSGAGYFPGTNQTGFVIFGPVP